jgi:hypothetical protein
VVRCEEARFNFGLMECRLGKSQKAVKHGTIAESAGHYTSMNELITDFKFGRIRGASIDSTLTAYNNSCAQMRSEARDAYIKTVLNLDKKKNNRHVNILSAMLECEVARDKLGLMEYKSLRGSEL